MSERAQTFLDKGTRFEGRILVTGVVRLDGYFKGDGQAQGTLVVGESGEVEAELEVDKFVVHGLFSGNVFAKERVEVGPTGRVRGSITTPILQVQDGAQITASIHMGEQARQRPVPSTSASPTSGESSPVLVSKSTSPVQAGKEPVAPPQAKSGPPDRAGSTPGTTSEGEASGAGERSRTPKRR